MEYLIGIIIGWFLTINYLSFIVRRHLNHISNHNNDSLIKLTIPVFTIEKHENILLLYDTTSNVFICQGSSLQELASKLLEHNKISIACVLHKGQKFFFHNGQIKT